MVLPTGRDQGESAGPAISIGMPVYNGAAHLPRALDSLLAQTLGDFDLTIADNASTDATRDICEAYSRNDPRIRYVRQPTNLGAVANFKYLLQQARGEYFMWAAVDDIRSPSFLQLNHRFLEQNSDYVASTCPTRFDEGEFGPVQMGDGLLDFDRFEDRVVSFLSIWHANAGFYSLFRRESLQAAAAPVSRFLGFDWVIMLRLATLGPFARLSEGWVQLGSRGESSSLNLFAAYRSRPVHWLLPFWDLSKAAMHLGRDFSSSARLRLICSLCWFNYRACRGQIGNELRKRGLLPLLPSH
jgi:hypothetical protein